jgi:hypothetical protein
MFQPETYMQHETSETTPKTAQVLEIRAGWRKVAAGMALAFSSTHSDH